MLRVLVGNKIDRDDHEIPLEVGEEFANRFNDAFENNLHDKKYADCTNDRDIRVNDAAGTECIFSKLRPKAVTTLIGSSLRLHTNCCNRYLYLILFSYFYLYCFVIV